jgi:hypothetical protein
VTFRVRSRCVWRQPKPVLQPGPPDWSHPVREGCFR